MSGSFRLGGLGKSANEPKPGDIIVFKKRNSEEAKVGFGHVGIFIAETDKGYDVLGGNQAHGKKYTSVNTTFIGKDYPVFELDSFRALDSIPRKP